MILVFAYSLYFTLAYPMREVNRPVYIGLLQRLRRD